MVFLCRIEKRLIMIIKQLCDEDFVNYKKASMMLSFPKCSFKCEKDCGRQVCQNGTLANSPNINVNIETLVNRYLKNSLTTALVCGGLEPFDSWEDLHTLVKSFREHTNDDIVIYTGYYKHEIEQQLSELKNYPNIIVKFGRFIPDKESHYDEVLGVNLASPNQHAERIS